MLNKKCISVISTSSLIGGAIPSAIGCADIYDILSNLKIKDPDFSSEAVKYNLRITRDFAVAESIAKRMFAILEEKEKGEGKEVIKVLKDFSKSIPDINEDSIESLIDAIRTSADLQHNGNFTEELKGLKLIKYLLKANVVKVQSQGNAGNGHTSFLKEKSLLKKLLSYENQNFEKDYKEYSMNMESLEKEIEKEVKYLNELEKKKEIEREIKSPNELEKNLSVINKNTIDKDSNGKSFDSFNVTTEDTIDIENKISIALNALSTENPKESTDTFLNVKDSNNVLVKNSDNNKDISEIQKTREQLQKNIEEIYACIKKYYSEQSGCGRYLATLGFFTDENSFPTDNYYIALFKHYVVSRTPGFVFKFGFNRITSLFVPKPLSSFLGMNPIAVAVVPYIDNVKEKLTEYTEYKLLNHDEHLNFLATASKFNFGTTFKKVDDSRTSYKKEIVSQELASTGLAGKIAAPFVIQSISCLGN